MSIRAHRTERLNTPSEVYVDHTTVAPGSSKSGQRGRARAHLRRPAIQPHRLHACRRVPRQGALSPPCHTPPGNSALGITGPAIHLHQLHARVGFPGPGTAHLALLHHARILPFDVQGPSKRPHLLSCRISVPGHCSPPPPRRHALPGASPCMPATPQPPLGVRFTCCRPCWPTLAPACGAVCPGKPARHATDLRSPAHTPGRKGSDH